MFECAAQIKVRVCKTERGRPRWLTGPLPSSAQIEGTTVRKGGEAQEAWKDGLHRGDPAAWRLRRQHHFQLLSYRQDVSPTKPWLNACPQA